MMRVAVFTAISISAQIINGTLNAKTIDSLLLKYQVATTAKELYQDKTKEIAGEEVAAKIDEAVAEAYKPPKDQTYKHTNHGDDPFILEILGMMIPFTSDVNYLKNIGVNTKDMILNENENVTVNELACDIGIGSVLKNDDGIVYGWHPDRFDKYRRDEFFQFFAMMDENDRPYTIVKCTCDPMPLYKPNSPRYH